MTSFGSSRPPSWILWVLLIKGGKGKEDKGWRGGEGKGKGDRGGKRRRREGKGSLGRGKKGGKENGGDKSPAWSSQDLGSTALYPGMLRIVSYFLSAQCYAK